MWSRELCENRFRLLVMDVDGTLVDDRQRIPVENVRAVERLQNAGIACALATGRTWISAEPYIRELALEAPSILYNGAQLVDSTGAVLQEQTLDPEPVMIALEQAARHGFTPFLYRGHEVLVDSITPLVAQQARKDGYTCPETGSLASVVSDATGGRPTKLLLVGTDAGAELLQRELQTRLAGKATVIRSETYFVEVLPPDSGKEAALRRLCSLGGFEIDRSVAIGDNLNDLEMVRYAGLGAAPRNAHREVRDVAGYVCTSDNNEGAIADLAAILLGEECAARVL
jgi:Cof subfamily protein (haloacid dehalogenase superfamily)